MNNKNTEMTTEMNNKNTEMTTEMNNKNTEMTTEMNNKNTEMTTMPLSKSQLSKLLGITLLLYVGRDGLHLLLKGSGRMIIPCPVSGVETNCRVLIDHKKFKSLIKAYDFPACGLSLHYVPTDEQDGTISLVGAGSIFSMAGERNTDPLNYKELSLFERVYVSDIERDNWARLSSFVSKDKAASFPQVMREGEYFYATDRFCLAVIRGLDSVDWERRYQLPPELSFLSSLLVSAFVHKDDGLGYWISFKGGVRVYFSWRPQFPNTQQVRSIVERVGYGEPVKVDRKSFEKELTKYVRLDYRLVYLDFSGEGLRLAPVSSDDKATSTAELICPKQLLSCIKSSKDKTISIQRQGTDDFPLQILVQHSDISVVVMGRSKNK